MGTIFNFFHLAWMLADRRVTATPARVLAELARRGKGRLPDDAGRELARRGRPGWAALRLAMRWLVAERLTRHDGQWVVNSFLPPLPGAAYDRLFENMLGGRRLSPVSAFLAVTADCPFGCWHCSVKGRRPGRLSREEWLKIVGELHGLGTSIIGFTGGEPLLREDLECLVRAASTGMINDNDNYNENYNDNENGGLNAAIQGAATILFTTGHGLTPERARRLREAGLWALCVSLDHPDPAQMDRLRGREGAHRTAVEALKIAREAGFYVMIGAVATRPFIEARVHERLWRLGRDLGVHELRLVEPMPCGRLAEADGATLLGSEHVRALREFHARVNRRRRGPKVCAFNQVESPELFGCGAGTQHLYIDPAGEACPCDFTPLSLGNAAREDLAAIWARMNRAMGDAPRRHCFIQRHHELVRRAALDLGVATTESYEHAVWPLPPDASERILAEAGPEPMPDFFQMTSMSANPPSEDKKHA
jgi:MoaA/NifB/PqqE/SkfB family radical SAM enzyme